MSESLMPAEYIFEVYVDPGWVPAAVTTSRNRRFYHRRRINELRARDNMGDFR